jgi:transposase
MAKENRRKEVRADGFATEEFQCVGCGYQAHADETAARVIAMKGAWFTFLPTRKWTREFRIS